MCLESTRPLRSTTFLFVFLAICFGAAIAQMGFPEFAADYSVTSSRRGEGVKGRMYFSHGKMRMDMNSKGGSQWMISDQRRQVVMLVMPEQKMYMELPANAAESMPGFHAPKVEMADPKNPCGAGGDLECENLGTDEINGRKTEKWQVRHKTGRKETQTTWIDSKLHIPIKTVGSDGTVMEMTNIVEGKQDESLFAVPAGFQKFDMKGMPGMPRPNR